MAREFTPRFSILLQPGATYTHPPAAPEPPELIDLDDQAIHVMTDFHYVTPQTVAPDILIDDALEQMKTGGVRLLLVINSDREIIGIITAKDIQGERPIKLAEQTRINRANILVSMIMTSQSDIPVLSMLSVTDAQIGHIVETLRELERQHILVVDIDSGSGKQTVCGVFSTSQISKQLKRDIAPKVTAAHSLSEIVQDVAE